MTNFKFLKNIDADLFAIVCEAEKLYRDEYFEQCMGQTRKFAENVCRNVLGTPQCENTFDDMLSNLKDKSSGAPREKEFIEDLYFLKKAGNQSVHGTKVKKDGILALECLQRAFEVAINYSSSVDGVSKKLDALEFDTELLILGKKSKKKTLAEKYSEEKQKLKTTKRGTPKNSTKTIPGVKKKIVTKKRLKKTKKNMFFKNLLIISFLAAIAALLILFFA